MEMNPDAPGNVSQKGVNSETNNETGFDRGVRNPPEQPTAGEQKVDDDLGFDPDSPDVADPQVDPPHPARTSNDPVPSDKRSNDDDQTSSGGHGI